MSKELLIKIYKIQALVMSLLIISGCSAVIIMSKNGEVKAVVAGIIVGVLLGSVIKIKHSIPRRYKNKDERTLLISLVASIISGSYFGIASFLAFILVVANIFTIHIADKNYIIAFIIIIGGTILADKISQKLLERVI